MPGKDVAHKLSCSLIPVEYEGLWEGEEDSLRTRALGDPLFAWVPARIVRSLRFIRHPVLHPTLGLINIEVRDPLMAAATFPTGGAAPTRHCSASLMWGSRRTKKPRGTGFLGRWKKNKTVTKGRSWKVLRIPLLLRRLRRKDLLLQLKHTWWTWGVTRRMTVLPLNLYPPPWFPTGNAGFSPQTRQRRGGRPP
jgi:hypothetical protein